MKEFMSDPIRQRAYQALGDLLIETAGVENPAGYKRSLDLDTGIVATEFTAGGVQYRREVFASFPANAIVVHLTASKPATFTTIVKFAHTAAKSPTRPFSSTLASHHTQSHQHRPPMSWWQRLISKL